MNEIDKVTLNEQVRQLEADIAVLEEAIRTIAAKRRKLEVAYLRKLIEDQDAWATAYIPLRAMLEVKQELAAQPRRRGPDAQHESGV